ncbi:MAG: DUF1566 domain-containing protein [Leptospiraceae bacterium]|nr:DUF1566 domain-containing protein [Leptospiraceae bacterium]NUM41993.1 DUF1566 domain-containing protein [Leptospiraceae bacterium]
MVYLIINCQEIDLPELSNTPTLISILSQIIQLQNSTVETPTLNPSSGHYVTPQTIILSTNTPGANIYYTLDESTPTIHSRQYSTGIPIWQISGKTIKAFASKIGMTESPIVESKFSYPPLKTGQTSCYDGVNNPVACGSYQGQDAQENQGVSRSYTDNGNYTITDNTTGLVWQKCSGGQNNDSTCSGIANLTNWTDANNYCNTLTLSGKNWRLPTYIELSTIVEHSMNPLPINLTNFPNTIAGHYWTKTNYLFDLSYAWVVNFSGGIIYANLKTDPYYVRCVSSSFSIDNNLQKYSDFGDGTILDKSTNLLWQKCTKGRNNDSTCSGVASPTDWQTALSYCNSLNLSGKTWRLPNWKELQSIVDYSVNSGASIFETIFPNTSIDNYWSSTTYVNTPANGIYVSFAEGKLFHQPKVNNAKIRCVSAP